MLGSEKAPEQFGLQIDFTPVWTPQGILASVPVHLGRHYADHGSLELRVAAIRNAGTAKIELFGWFPNEGPRAAVELDHRMLAIFPRQRIENGRFIGMGEPRPESPGDSLVNYRAEFDVESLRMVFARGGSEAVAGDWRRDGAPRGVSVRGGETVEIRVTLRLRPEVPLVPSAPPGPGGVDGAVAAYFPPDAPGASELLLAQIVSVASGLVLGVRREAEEDPEIFPLFLDRKIRSESRLLSTAAREIAWDLPLPSVRYRFSRLPILL